MASSELSDVASILAGAPVDEPGENLENEPETVEIQDQASTESADTDTSSNQSSSEGLDGGSEDPGDSAEIESLTVAGIAEQLGLEPKAVYDSLTLSIGGNDITLGELKDRGKDLLRSDELLASSEAEFAKVSKDIAEIQRAAALVVQRAGRQPTMAERAEATDLYNAEMRKAAQQTLELIPEWKDQTLAATEYGQISSMLEGRGFKAMEVEAITDARQIKLLRDAADAFQRLERAKQPTRNKPGTTRRGGKRITGAGDTANKIRDAVKAGTMSQRDAATAILLGK
jgi:hypothetical protein